MFQAKARPSRLSRPLRYSWHLPVRRNSPVVRDGESSHGNVVTLGAEVQQRQQVSSDGGGEVELSPRHHAQLVPFHYQPSK